MTIAKAAAGLMEVAEESRVLGKFSVVIHFDDVLDQKKFEAGVLRELQVNSLRSDPFTTVNDLRFCGIPFEFVTPRVFAGDD